MAIPSGVARVVFSGKLAGGEEWASGFYVFDTDIDSSAAASDLAETIHNIAVSGSSGAIMTYCAVNIWSAQTTFDTVTVYAYPSGGPTAEFIGSFATGTSIVGTRSTILPNQCALVASLRTPLAGRRHRGRMYMPATGAGLDGLGSFGPAAADALCQEWADFFTAVNGAIGGVVVVVSTAGSSHTAISYVVVDTKIDIQRRRANHEAVEHVASAGVT